MEKMTHDSEDGQPSSHTSAEDIPIEKLFNQAMEHGYDRKLEKVKGFYESGSDIGTVKILGTRFGPEDEAAMLFFQFLKDQGREITQQDVNSIQDTSPPITLFTTRPPGRIGEPLLIIKDIMAKLRPIFPGIGSVSSVNRALHSTNEQHVSKTIDNALAILERLTPHVLASATFPHQANGKMLCLVTGLDRAIKKGSEGATQAGRLVAVEYLAGPGSVEEVYQGGWE
ncbi:hypothetical protein SLS62_011200 [Diatrype stigma]|uniref:Uncharacterized protein n=1 Tax=Diatrype stigma TaxID=117547 RepID=A0AAN9YEA6_9PEZI